MAVNNAICQLASAEGDAVGGQLDIPQDAGPKELSALLNQLLHNEEALPYAFYINDVELTQPLGEHLLQHKVSVEKVLQIVYQPQAVFRVRPVTRCSATIPGHTEAVLAVAFSPDGKQLASGSGDTTVRLWDIFTQTPLKTFTGHKNWVLVIAWSPDGRLLASGGMEGDLMLWDPSSGKSLGAPLKGHSKWITSVAWEPAHCGVPCRRLASGSRDGDVRVWDVARRATILTLTGHTLAVTCVKWGGDGTIFSGSRDCTIKMWDSNTGRQIRELKGHGHWVNSLALSTEHVLRTGPFDHRGRAPADDADAAAAARERYVRVRGERAERLVSGSDDFSMILWEPHAGLPGKGATAADAAAAGADGKTHNVLKARMTGHQQLVNHVQFSPDGRWIASASFDKSVKLWDGLTGRFVASFRGHVGPVYQISWSGDSRLLVSASKDSTMKVWDLQTRKMREDLPGHADEVFAVDWCPTGQKVASGGKDRVLKLWMA